ncbi:hypothetical protein [Pelobium manganitolerans]|uniref:hypothetical protein n=1 Tax=Pelobium manganitolerans TaxID=1842495 RepID=UPI003FA3D9DC
MKTKLLALALACLAFTACKKDDNDAPKNAKLVKKIISIEDGDTTSTSFSYDANRRINLVKINDGTQIKLAYAGDLLSTIETINEDDNSKLVVSYDGNKPVSAVQSVYEDDELINKFKYTYTLNANNQVKEILIKDSTNTTVIGKQVITYNGNNVSKYENYVGDNLVSSQEMTYGSKKSAFYNARVKYILDPSVAEAFSANDLLKQKYTFAGQSREITSTYTYDAEGFPTAANLSDKVLPDGTPSTSKLKFEY